MSKKIIDLSVGTPNDQSLGFIGDPNTGALTKSTFLNLKGYFQSGSSLLMTGSYVTTGSFNAFSASYHNDSASFYLISRNTISSQSGFVQTSSYLPFSSSVSTDSGSFDSRIKAISGSSLTGSFVSTITFGTFSASATLDSASTYNKIINVYGSESNYVPTASFNPYTASINQYTSSINAKISNVFASESNYLPSASFNQFSGSYVTDSGSFNTHINNVFASESNYLPSASIQGNNNYVAIYSGSQFLTFANLYQSGSSLLIGAVNGQGNALLQVAGDVLINSTGYLKLPAGTTIQRPTGSAASFPMFRGNTDNASLEYYNGSQWLNLGSGSGLITSGSVTSVGLTLPSSLFTVNNSPVVGAGVISASLNTQSANLVYASPTGVSGVPTFRALTIADISALTSSFIGNYVLTGSFNTFSSSYLSDSGSFDLRISNIYSSESLYLRSSSFNIFSSSYSADSSSFGNIIANVYASESNYLNTGSYLLFSASYFNDSSSAATILANIFASESNYLPLASIKGVNNYLAVFSGSSAVSNSIVYQSNGSIIIGSTTGSNASVFQVVGNTSLSGSLYDSSNNTGSSGQILATTSTGLLWISTGSNNWNLAGNNISSGSFIGTTNAQDLILKRNSIQIASFGTNNNVVLGNPNNTLTGSNSIVLGGSNNFSNNMTAVINGANNISVGNSSIVVGGQNNITPGVASVSLGGLNQSASAYAVVTMGRFNDPISSSNSSAWIGSDPILIIGNGTSTSSLANALVVYKTGSLSFPFYSNNQGSVLGVDNNGNVTNVPFYGSSSINVDSSSFNNRINNVFASESRYILTSSYNTLISGSNSYLAIFSGSHALSSSFIYVLNTINSPILIVSGAIATQFSNVLNTGSVAFGFGATSYGKYSFVHGNMPTTTGDYSHAEGFTTNAAGAGSHAEGSGSVTFGTCAHAEGLGTSANGDYSHADGIGTISSGSGQVAIGRYNNINTSSLFIIGNGNSGSRNDLALFNTSSIQFNKDLILSGSVHLSQSIYDSSGSSGTIGQILSSTVNGIQWIDVSGSSGINGFVTNGVFQAYTSSTGIQIANVYASESKYLLTSSYNVDSSSFSGRINNVFSSESNYLPTSSYLIDSSSVLNKISNVYSSESNYTPTSSFNSFSSSYVVDSSSLSLVTTNLALSGSKYLLTSSFNSFSSSYVVDSASFVGKVNNVFASESNYVLTSSYLPFSSSYSIDSSSFNNRIINVFASESNYLSTASLRGVSNYIPIFSGSNILITSSIYQSTGSIIIGNSSGSNNSILQIFGNIYISRSIYDSTNSTGSINQVLTNTSTGAKWTNSGSGGTSVLNFIVGDSQSFTPTSGSTQFSSSNNPLVGRTVLQFFMEGALLAPISRSVAWYSTTSSAGIINLQNCSFDLDTFYSILYI